MELAQLALFVRPPTAGQVKTRLAAVLGARGAAELYRAFVEDTLSLCSRVREAGQVELALWSAGPLDEVVSEWASRLGVPVRLQPDGDLGTRLDAAFEQGFKRFQRVVIIGSDAPTLPLGLIGAAFDALDDAPIMLGPSNDGGYYAIGASQQVRPSFDGVRWSTPHTMADTVKANVPRPIAVVSPWYDIDEPEDLAILRAHISTNPAIAPATARCLQRIAGPQR
ncbi:MAG: TIGR04282 family arsenosugar biosynthesis glycosyltransferase [Polyangiales bacterium]